MKGKKRISLLAVLICIFALVFSMGLMSACGNTDNTTASNQWYYGAEVPADTLGAEGDFYLNTKTLSSYKKTSAGWTAVAMDESGEWLYGVGGPKAEQGAPNDFYLDTQNGDLYHKTATGWENILKLFGKNGRDGVLWFSGEGNPNGLEDKTPLTGSMKGDFYLDYSKFDVYQLGEDGKTWNELGSLKGETGKNSASWQMQAGSPMETMPDADDGTYYLDTKTGKIWKATKDGESTLWEELYDTSGREIVAVRENTIRGLYSNEAAHQVGTEFVFKDGTTAFVQTGCSHSVDWATAIYVYQNDCERGTLGFAYCKYCNEWLLEVTPPGVVISHKYDTNWSSNEKQHWHAPTCSHKATLENKDVGDHSWLTYYAVDYDEASEEVKGYIKMQECRICGYVDESGYLPKTDALINQEDGKVHISTMNDWRAFISAVNGDKTYSYKGEEGKKFAEATVELDEDIDFGGLKIDPVGLPSNAAEVTDYTNGMYLDLKAEAVIEGGFKGTFNGNGHTISNFMIDGGNFMGLFGYLDGATVTDFTVKDAEVKGDAFVGAVAGFIAGKTVSISKVTVIDTPVTALAHAGGIAGYAKNAGPKLTRADTSANAAIKNCTVMGSKFKTNDEMIGGTDATMMIYVVPGMKDPADSLYYDSTNAGGILGTSYSSSVIGCFATTVDIYGAGVRGRVVGFASGTSDAYSVITNNRVGVQYPQVLPRGSATVTTGSLAIYDRDHNRWASGSNQMKGHPSINGNDFIGAVGQNANNNIISGNELNNTAPYDNALPVRARTRTDISPLLDGVILEIKTAQDLLEWAERITVEKIPYTNSYIYLSNDITEINFSTEQVWTPINAFNAENPLLNNSVFNGNGKTIRNLHFEENATTGTYPYGLGFIGSITGTFTIRNVTFDAAKVYYNGRTYYGNVIGTVFGYIYGTVLMDNVTVQNSMILGYGKVGGLVGMGADPGVHITFKDCKSLNNNLYGVYNVGGFAGNIQRATDGTDNTVFEGTNVANNPEPHLAYGSVNLDGTAPFCYNDRSGSSYTQEIKGRYVELPLEGYEKIYFAAYATYYVSYGWNGYNPDYTGTADNEPVEGYIIADSEICMDEPETFVHSDTPIVPEE